MASNCPPWAVSLAVLPLAQCVPATLLLRPPWWRSSAACYQTVCLAPNGMPLGSQSVCKCAHCLSFRSTKPWTHNTKRQAPLCAIWPCSYDDWNKACPAPGPLSIHHVAIQEVCNTEGPLSCFSFFLFFFLLKEVSQMIWLFLFILGLHALPLPPYVIFVLAVLF